MVRDVAYLNRNDANRDRDIYLLETPLGKNTLLPYDIRNGMWRYDELNYLPDGYEVMSINFDSEDLYGLAKDDNGVLKIFLVRGFNFNNTITYTAPWFTAATSEQRTALTNASKISMASYSGQRFILISDSYRTSSSAARPLQLYRWVSNRLRLETVDADMTLEAGDERVFNLGTGGHGLFGDSRTAYISTAYNSTAGWEVWRGNTSSLTSSSFAALVAKGNWGSAAKARGTIPDVMKPSYNRNTDRLRILMLPTDRTQNIRVIDSAIATSNASWTNSTISQPSLDSVRTPTFYDRRTDYDVSISALKSADIRDIHVSQGYAWVLTDTKLYRHPLTSAGTVLDTALPTDKGDSRRITGDSNHLYIAYSDSSGSPVVNKVEKRTLHAPATVEDTWTLAFDISNAWSSKTGDNVPFMLPVFAMATTDNMNHVLISCARRSNSNRYWYYAAAFSKVDGRHESNVPPTDEQDSSYGRETIQSQIIGATIDNNVYWRGAFTPNNTYQRAFLWFMENNHVNFQGHSRNYSDSHSQFRISDNYRGLASYNGILWSAISTSAGTTLLAYQGNVASPPNPLQNPPVEQQAQVRAVEYWRTDTAANDRYIFLGSDRTRQNLLIPYIPASNSWDFNNIHALSNTHRVLAISILNDVVYAWIEDESDVVKIITYNLTTKTESAAVNAFWWARANATAKSAMLNKAKVSFAMRSPTEAWVLIADRYIIGVPNYTQTFQVWRVLNTGAFQITPYSDMRLTTAGEQVFNISNSGNAGTDGDNTQRWSAVYDNNTRWETWYVNNDNPRSDSQTINPAQGLWGRGDHARGSRPLTLTLAYNATTMNPEIISIPESIHDPVRIMRVTSYNQNSVWTEVRLPQPVTVEASVTLTPRNLSVRAGGSTVIDVAFSKPVSGFTLSDIEVTKR